MKNSKIIAVLLALVLIVSACAVPKKSNEVSEIPSVLATTTMAYDLVQVIGQDKIYAQALMLSGVDPHLYTPTAKDVQKLTDADLVVYSGLHLEGKLEDVFENLELKGKRVIALSENIPDEELIKVEGESVYDPHFWWDPILWKYAAENVRDGLSEMLPEHAQFFASNCDEYLKQLDELYEWSAERIAEIPEESRVLVTAHDAFSYLAKRYGLEVHGIQGISTDAEAGAGSVDELSKYIAERGLKAVFMETSVPVKTIEALISAVKSKGHSIEIGGELYSDSLGEREEGNYIASSKANINTIVDALK